MGIGAQTRVKVGGLSDATEIWVGRGAAGRLYHVVGSKTWPLFFRTLEISSVSRQIRKFLSTAVP
jgi:hypothetical protein